MKNRLYQSLLLLGLSLLPSCGGKDPAYLYVSDPLPIQERDERFYPMDLLKLDTVDVVMIIDNSGSMGSIQDNIKANASLFFTEFAKQDYLKWKLGVISTDQNQEPFLGFAKPFDSEQILSYDPTSFDLAVRKFQSAIDDLGTSGSASEYSFYNLERHLNTFTGSTPSQPAFVRSSSHLFFILVSDEIEQSEKDFGVNYEATTFLNRIRSFAGSNKKVRFYGAFDHKVFTDCRGLYFTQDWDGNPFDVIINASEGFAISACIADFGAQLSRIAEDIVSLVSLPSLLLKRRPKGETIKVYYQEAKYDPNTGAVSYPESIQLKSGSKPDGGQWYYDASTNTINFYSVSFVKDLENDRFVIDFDVDDGINRDE